MSPDHALLTRRLLAAVLVVAAGCTDRVAGPDLTSNVGVVEDSIVPSVTDALIDRALDNHRIFLDGGSRSNHLLLVFMPGTGAQPAKYLFVQREAARLGYHVIGLMYQNDVKLAKVCSVAPDPSSCFQSARLEILDGVDRTPMVDVSTANSIENRLAKLLAWLAANRPLNEQWSQFLEAGGPVWSRIAVAGHSQGGGEAMIIAKVHVVARVVTFSATPDDIGGAVAPPWEALHATPTSRYFGLAHKSDPAFPAIVANWAMLGMSGFGSAVVAEASSPPYGSTHSLITNLMPQQGSFTFSHNATAFDADTPVDSITQVPKLRDAWRYLLDPAVP